MGYYRKLISKWLCNTIVFCPNVESFLVTVSMGTYWSLSICDIKYMCCWPNYLKCFYFEKLFSNCVANICLSRNSIHTAIVVWQNFFCPSSSTWTLVDLRIKCMTWRYATVKPMMHISLATVTKPLAYAGFMPPGNGVRPPNGIIPPPSPPCIGV